MPEPGFPSPGDSSPDAKLAGKMFYEDAIDEAMAEPDNEKLKDTLRSLKVKRSATENLDFSGGDVSAEHANMGRQMTLDERIAAYTKVLSDRGVTVE